MLYPLLFQPILKERVWGGRQLARLFDKPLPPGIPIGESWEISDRPGDVSVIAHGPLQGTTLRQLMEQSPDALLGTASSSQGRFPLLIKILDAQQTLSLQVHPPARVAAQFQGEPKTELWFIVNAEPGATLFAGLKHGVSRQELESRLSGTSVADCFHRIPVQAGDCMFVPSGRVHAIGAGCVLFEIQQNSDTTYRVFDWNRTGLDGRPRQLHIRESLESIDFEDFEPELVAGTTLTASGDGSARILASHPLFDVTFREGTSPLSIENAKGGPLILGVVEGSLRIEHSAHPLALGPGQFSLLPACALPALLSPLGRVSFLVIRPGSSNPS